MSDLSIRGAINSALIGASRASALSGQRTQKKTFASKLGGLTKGVASTGLPVASAVIPGGNVIGAAMGGALGGIFGEMEAGIEDVESALMTGGYRELLKATMSDFRLLKNTCRSLQTRLEKLAPPGTETTRR